MKKKIIILLSIISFFCFDVFAAKVSKKKIDIQKPVSSSLVVDASSGKILHSNKASKQIYPASLTKMMTLYLVFDAIKANKISMDDVMHSSKYATTMQPSKLGLKVNEKIKVKEAVMALIIKSANDAAVVLAEYVSGSEENFARRMNIYARKIGMNATSFANASGLHDPKQVTTAVDMAKLAIALRRDFPEYYSLFSEKKFDFKGRTYFTHNHITRKYPGAEGLKTGYVNASGFNIVSTAMQKGKRLIAVVTGGETAKSRDMTIVKLLDKHFANNNEKSIKQHSAELQQTKSIAKYRKKSRARKRSSTQTLTQGKLFKSYQKKSSV